MEIDLDPAERIELHAMDRSTGLPAGLPAIERGPGVIPDSGSDEARVGKRVGP
jgi:hypothetical protein